MCWNANTWIILTLWRSELRWSWLKPWVYFQVDSFTKYRERTDWEWPFTGFLCLSSSSVKIVDTTNQCYSLSFTNVYLQHKDINAQWRRDSLLCRFSVSVRKPFNTIWILKCLNWWFWITKKSIGKCEKFPTIEWTWTFRVLNRKKCCAFFSAASFILNLFFSSFFNRKSLRTTTVQSDRSQWTESLWMLSNGFINCCRCVFVVSFLSTTIFVSLTH